MFQQHASVSQGRICSDNCTCCHTETEVAIQTFYLTQSQYTDTGLTSPRPPDVRTARKWKAEVATDEIISSLEQGDIVGPAQPDRLGLGNGNFRPLGKCLNGTEEKLQ